MLEIWANLFGLTKKQKYLDLMERYGNPDLFQSLLKGEDALSNEHANASIPWSHGSARTYEVTGNSHWRDITMGFWKNAVIDRESFCMVVKMQESIGIRRMNWRVFYVRIIKNIVRYIT